MSRFSISAPIAPRNNRETARKTASSAMSSESVAADVAAFRAAGGQIEVLGTTQTLKKITPPTA